MDGEDRSTARPLRPAAPPDGLLASSGVAPDPMPVPRPRRPWLRSETPEPVPAAGSEPTAATTAATSTEPAAAAVPASTVAEPATTATGSEQTTTSDAAGEKTAQPAAGSTDGPAGKATGESVDKTVVDDAPAAGSGDGTSPAAARRRRAPFAHAVRLPPPRQAIAGAARATRAWSRRPSGRLTLPGVFLLVLVAATAAAGALLVPATTGSSRPVAVDATASGPGVAVPEGGVLPGATAGALPSGLPGGTASPGFPGGVLPTGPAAGPVATGRPADALADWARVTGTRVGVSPVAMQAYGYAELVLAQTHRSCQLSWTTLAAIGYVESRHGQANGATLKSEGRAEPEIIGDPLDGQGGRSRIVDTDRGLFDRDTVYDRAIGPMQFIPTTWQEIGADADNDGRRDPHDLDDAALAAGNYLCKGGRNMTIPGDWWGAILSYNDVRRYADDVFDKANEYGIASHT